MNRGKNQPRALGRSGMQRECKNFIAENTSTSSNQNVGLLKFVKDFPAFFYGMLGKPRDHAFEVTNIGVVDGGLLDGVGKATFNNLIFSSSLCTYGDPYCISIVSAKNGDMTIALSWESGVVEDNKAEEIINWLEIELKNFV